MSKIEVNEIDKQNGSTLTIGGSGTTVQLGTGASQTGFGRSGSVDWQTTPKTTTFTAASGEGYFINSGSSITANLPAGSAGAIVAFSDYARNFATYPFIIAPNGSEKIGGVAETLQLDVNGQAITLVYVDSTKGWVNVQNAEDTEVGTAAAFITATGGTITTVCTNFKVHTFTGPGTFCVSCAGNSKGSDKVSYLVVAGGGEGGSTAPSNGGGGGGAGGYREAKNPDGGYTASPIASTCGLAVTGAIPITVGAGGAQQPNPSNNLGNSGSNSIFSTITSAGGGGGKIDSPAGEPGTAGDGGSGGGGSAASAASRNAGGSGNTPPTNPAQGTDGGTGGPNSDGVHGGGGGGGATGVGGNVNPGNNAGTGGVGATTNITGSPVAYAGGGGAAATGGGAPARGAASPCGTGGQGGSFPNLDGSAGTTNRGGGGGSGGWPAAGTARGAGGSGIVIIRYKFQ